MCEAMERIEARGEARGLVRGKREGIAEGKLKNMFATARSGCSPTGNSR